MPPMIQPAPALLRPAARSLLRALLWLPIMVTGAISVATAATAATDPMFTPKTDVAFPGSVTVTYRQPVEMRDGVALSTHTYLPAPEGSFPTLLVRDIYGNGSQAGRQRLARFATQNGYAFVYQTARGRFDSEGHWYPYFQEIPDGEIYPYELDLWATSYELAPGDSLRLDITSSNFPRLNRNPNTGAPFAETTELRAARQTIYTGSRYPSQVVLPLIPAGEGDG